MKPSADPFRPHIFGKFFLLQKLGMGGMAEIYRAKLSGTGGFEKELVIKRILPALSSDTQFPRMLINEAKLTVALTHPAIAQIYELGEIDGQYFISMELVEGATLHDLMFLANKAGRPLTIEQSIYLCLEVLRGLDYAHKRTDGGGKQLGIVHCDVSPDNVMVTWDGGVKLLDFGVARAAQSSLSNYKEGTLMGKLSYASPEQAEGERFDHRVDLFAVGVMFYELLTGTHPFGRVQTVEALIASRKKKVVPPSRVRKELPSLLDGFVLRSLAHSKEERFQSAKDMADELIEFLFPTPTQAIAEHLSASMRELYRDRIERQQRLRANDSLHMKVLAHARTRTGEVSIPPTALSSTPPPSASSSDDFDLRPEQGTKILVSGLDPNSVIMGLESSAHLSSTPAMPRPRTPSRSTSRRIHVPRGGGAGRASLLVAGILGVGLGGGGAWTLLQQQAPPLVVLSEPSGAEVSYDGLPLGKTPLILDRSPLPRSGGEVRLELAGFQEATVHPRPVDGRVLHATATLASSLGTLRIESRPAGASVKVDGEEVGRTPVDVKDVPMNEAHRIELELRGHQPDTFVKWPHDPERSIVRTLQPL